MLRQKADWCVSCVALVTLVAATGCGSDEKVKESAGGSGEWSTLIQADWDLEPATEGYTCQRATVPEDIYVRAYRPIAPLGTHHTLFTLGGQATGDEETEPFECSAGMNERTMIFGSGVGTEVVEFPPGVAMKLEKGSKMMLNLHLFNVSGEPITGKSGLEIQRVDPSEVEHVAESVLAGKIGGLTVVPGVSTQTGTCEMSHDVTLFAVFPHMHQLGAHLKATAETASGDPIVLTDRPYSFEEQRYYPLSPAVSLKAGDKVNIECEYNNTTGETVGFGDSSLKEMCFTGLFRYPKGETSQFVCSEGGVRPILNGPACVEPGAPGNEVGIGKHCTNGGGECGGSSICLADYTDGEFGNFCTSLCADNAECGAGAACKGEGNKACIPDGCDMPTPEPGDGGTSL
jgi:hypothetical protein